RLALSAVMDGVGGPRERPDPPEHLSPGVGRCVEYPSAGGGLSGSGAAPGGDDLGRYRVRGNPVSRRPNGTPWGVRPATAQALACPKAGQQGGGVTTSPAGTEGRYTP